MKVLKFILLGLIIFFGNSLDSFAGNKNLNQTHVNIKKDSIKLLKSVKSEYSAKLYKYNGDLTLQSITEKRNKKKRNETKFVYKDGKVSEILWEDFVYKSKARRVLEYKGDLLIKVTGFVDNEVVDIVEYFHDENNRMIKQIQKLEWNDEANKQTRIIDIHHVEGKNELQVKYNDVLAFIVTYANTASPYANIKGYSQIYAAHLFYGVTNNVINFTRVYKNGNSEEQTTDLTFDSSGKYLIEANKKGDDQRVFCKEIYTYN